MPEGKFWIRNRPCSSLTTLRVRPVEFAVTVIMTPGRTAPVWSDTVPARSAVTPEDCAIAAMDVKTTRTNCTATHMKPLIVSSNQFVIRTGDGGCERCITLVREASNVGDEHKRHDGSIRASTQTHKVFFRSGCRCRREPSA